MKEDSMYFWIGVGTGLIGPFTGMIVLKMCGVV